MFNIFRGPIELLMGIVFGGLVGVLCWFLPNKTEVNILLHVHNVYAHRIYITVETLCFL